MIPFVKEIRPDTAQYDQLGQQYKNDNKVRYDSMSATFLGFFRIIAFKVTVFPRAIVNLDQFEGAVILASWLDSLAFHSKINQHIAFFFQRPVLRQHSFHGTIRNHTAEAVTANKENISVFRPDGKITIVKSGFQILRDTQSL